MALPVAHIAVAWGMTRFRDPSTLAIVALLSIVPDLDFALVWGLDYPQSEMHRTWSHSLGFALVTALIWILIRPRKLAQISATLVFAVVASHGVLDLLCTLDVMSHGVMVLWPFSQLRLGWPVLVPIYWMAADSPFSWEGALRFTALELVLAVPLFLTTRATSQMLIRLLR